MSTMKNLAMGMKNFAKGIYSEANPTAAKIGKNIANSSSYKAGKTVAKSAPLKGIMSSTNAYYNSNGTLGIKNAAILGHSKMVNGQMKLDYKKVAGTAFTVGVAGRVATGGGLYRDRNGNVNVPGVPFI